MLDKIRFFLGEFVENLSLPIVSSCSDCTAYDHVFVFWRVTDVSMLSHAGLHLDGFEGGEFIAGFDGLDQKRAVLYLWVIRQVFERL